MKISTLSWIIIHDETNDLWSAQCVEHDIATQDKTYNGLLYQIAHQLRCHSGMAQTAGTTALKAYGPPPQPIIDMFNKARSQP